MLRLLKSAVIRFHFCFITVAIAKSAEKRGIWLFSKLVKYSKPLLSKCWLLLNRSQIFCSDCFKIFRTGGNDIESGVCLLLKCVIISNVIHQKKLLRKFCQNCLNCALGSLDIRIILIPVFLVLSCFYLLVN